MRFCSDNSVGLGFGCQVKYSTKKEATRAIWSYVKEHDLQVRANGGGGMRTMRDEEWKEFGGGGHGGTIQVQGNDAQCCLGSGALTTMLPTCGVSLHT